ncbi:MAG TPA: endonuclease MutS2 [Granulicella sp.]
MPAPSLEPAVPAPLTETAATSLEWPRLREHLAGRTVSPLGRAWVLALEPSADLAWINEQHRRTAELRAFLESGGSFTFHGLFDPTALLHQARIEGAALEALDILALATLAERVAAWRNLLEPTDPSAQRFEGEALRGLSASLLDHDLAPLLRLLRGKIEPDGTLADDASPELARIRRALERQHRAIEESLRRASNRLKEEGSSQDNLITLRNDRFVIPVKAEFKRRVPGVIHGSSSSGQTVFIEPLETIEQNNELVRLLDDEQAEVHRILVSMTRALGQNADTLSVGASILAEVESHHARARFAQDLRCTTPTFGTTLNLTTARHPLLELRMREDARKEKISPSGGSVILSEVEGPASRTTPDAKGPVPLTIALPADTKQLIISGPNTGGKTVSLKTLGLLALMAQAGIPIPADEAALPLFTAIYADIGDAQSIERNLSSFSAHVVNVDRISRVADADSLVLLDELGSATDPEEGAALAVAVAEHFLHSRAWSIITTHLTSLKVYAANHTGVLNAAVGFDQQTLAPTYQLRLGVPGASAGLNIAERLGMDPAIVAAARSQLSTQTADIAAFLDRLHDQITAATAEREALAAKEKDLARERARLEIEGRAEQKARLRELEEKLNAQLASFDAELKDVVRSIDDKALSQKIARESALRMSRVRREHSEQFKSTVVAHNTGADKTDKPHQKPLATKKELKPGDLVYLRSLNRQVRVERLIDAKSIEVSVGSMKMRADRSDIADVTPVQAVTPLEAARKRGGVTIQTSSENDYVPSEINVIGRTADEAMMEVERFLDRAFLAGLPRIRVVHGTGMGILRRTLRDLLQRHPHVASIEEPPQNLGGQGATEVALRQ